MHRRSLRTEVRYPPAARTYNNLHNGVSGGWMRGRDVPSTCSTVSEPEYERDGNEVHGMSTQEGRLDEIDVSPRCPERLSHTPISVIPRARDDGGTHLDPFEVGHLSSQAADSEES